MESVFKSSVFNFYQNQKFAHIWYLSHALQRRVSSLSSILNLLGINVNTQKFKKKIVYFNFFGHSKICLNQSDNVIQRHANFYFLVVFLLGNIGHSQFKCTVAQKITLRHFLFDVSFARKDNMKHQNTEPTKRNRCHRNQMTRLDSLDFSQKLVIIQCCFVIHMRNQLKYGCKGCCASTNEFIIFPHEACDMC